MSAGSMTLSPPWLTVDLLDWPADKAVDTLCARRDVQPGGREYQLWRADVLATSEIVWGHRMNPSDDGPASFEDFYSRHRDGLARLAYLVMGEPAEADDVAADALVAAWQNWDRVRNSDSPIAYVRRMVVNIAISRVRGRVRDRRRLLALIPATVDQSTGPDSAAVMDVRSALMQLGARRRACLVLRYAFDLSEAEVAETLQIAIGTVKSQTSKAAAQLRPLLRDMASRDAAPSAGLMPVARTGPLQGDGQEATT